MSALLAALALAWARPAAAADDPGRALEASGRYDEAAADYRERAAASPGDAGALKRLMWAQWAARRFAEARDTAARVLAAEPGDPDAREVSSEAGPSAARETAGRLRSEAAAAWRSGDRRGAVSLYERAAVLQPGDFLAARDLMWALERSGRAAEAVAAARRALKLRPGDQEARTVLARGFARLAEEAREARFSEARRHLAEGRPRDAAVLLRALAGEKPERRYYRRALVLALTEAGDTRAAFAEARALVDSDPRDAGSRAALGALQHRLGLFAAARATLERSLALKADQPSVALELAELDLRDRDFAGAEARLRPLEGVSDARVAAAVEVALGQALFWEGRPAEALPRLDEAAKTHPGRADARYQRALALLQVGRAPEGRAELERLAALGRRRAEVTLIDEAVQRGDLPRAALARLAPADEGLALRVADLMAQAGRLGDADAMIDRVLALVPGSQPAWLQKAAVAQASGRLGEARRLALRGLAVNRDAVDPYELLGDLAEATGDRAEALRRAEEALRLSPTDPDLRRRRARALREAGRGDEARRVIEALLSGPDAGPFLPILLYHGLTPHEDDPMLAYYYHQSTRTFASQIGALAGAGYAPITARQAADWLAGKSSLPPKAVLVTFDDARSDSFDYGDPILARFGFKATMMAALTNVDGPTMPAGFAGWEKLSRYAANGRWEVEAHGDLAHDAVDADAGGRRGLFLINRRWLPAARRLETTEEWRARLASDYTSCAERLEQKLGRAPVAYAFPEGADGRKSDISNSPDSFLVNRQLVERRYRIAFVQDHTGINARDRDPYALARLEPVNTWDGARLVRHLADATPAAKDTALLLDWAVEERRFDEARRQLARLEALGASQALRLAEEATIRFYAGDEEGGLALARRAEALGEDERAPKLLDQGKAAARPAWLPGYQYYGDNDGRRAWTLSQGLELGRFGRWRPRLQYRRGELVQDSSAFVGDNAVGAGADVTLAPGQQLSADLLHHLLSGRAPDRLEAQAALASSWGRGIETRALVARGPVYNALSLEHGLWQRRGDGLAVWRPDESWRLSTRLQGGWYSDANTRWTTESEVGRRLLDAGPLTLRGVYRFVYDAARSQSPDYYAPLRLTSHAFGPEVELLLAPRARLTARVLPARSSEQGAPPAWVEEGQAYLDLGLTEHDRLKLGVELTRTPTYRAAGVTADAVVRFR